MNKGNYDEIKAAYESVINRKCDQSGSSNGEHYILVYKLMKAGFQVRGFTNGEIEGLASMLIMRDAQRW